MIPQSRDGDASSWHDIRSWLGDSPNYSIADKNENIPLYISNSHARIYQGKGGLNTLSLRECFTPDVHTRGAMQER